MAFGRPLRWKSAKELQEQIDSYFKSISYEEPVIVESYVLDDKGNVQVNDTGTPIKKHITLRDDNGNVVTDTKFWKPPTASGLASYLKTNRQTIINYEKKDDFIDTIKNAKVKLEAYYEQRFIENGHAGNIFAAKNFGFKDTQQIEHTGRQITFVNE